MAEMNRLELSEVERLCKTFPPKYAALVAIGATTGCRISEILALTRKDLIQDCRLKEMVRFVKLKSRGRDKHREIGIPPDFQGFVIEFLNLEANRGYIMPECPVFRGKGGLPLSRHSVYHFFRAKLGRGYGTHWMRKTFAYELFTYYKTQNPMDQIGALEQTRQALGHARLETTIRYLGLRKQNLAQAQRNIFKIGKEQ